MFRRDLFQNAFRLRDDFRAHPVAGNYGYCEGLHGLEHNCILACLDRPGGLSY